MADQAAAALDRFDMTVEAERLLAVAEVADRLQMTPDGVYKLIQRGKLETVRISERKTRIPERAFHRYYDELQARADRYLEARPRISVELARAEFEATTDNTPDAWLAAWKRDEIEDSAENMSLLARACEIQAAEAAAPAAG